MSAGGAEEGVAPDPLDTPQVVLMSASEEAGDCISFRSMAQMLHAGKLSPEDKVFVPPALLEDARVVSEMVDMEDVAEMDDDDIDELARQFMDELVPKAAVDFSADRDCELQSALDPMDLEVARIAESQPLTAALYDRGLGNFRGPVELPPELAAVAERDLGETVEVRTKALKDLRARLEQLEAEGVKGQPIQFPRKDDQFLICFLRSRKFRLKDAEKVGPRMLSRFACTRVADLQSMPGDRQVHKVHALARLLARLDGRPRPRPRPSLPRRQDRDACAAWDDADRRAGGLDHREHRARENARHVRQAQQGAVRTTPFRDRHVVGQRPLFAHSGFAVLCDLG